MYVGEPELVARWDADAAQPAKPKAVAPQQTLESDEQRDERELLTLPWPEWVPDDAMLKRGLAMLEHGDRLKPNQMRNHASAHDRADGFVAEEVMDKWLTWLGVPHVWNGGPNALPDFVIRDSHEIAFRACATRKNLTPQNYVYIFEQHAHGIQHRFFGYVNRRSGRYYLVGGTTLDAFMEKAELYEKGSTLMSGFVCRENMYVRRIADCLTDPLAWLAPLNR